MDAKRAASNIKTLQNQLSKLEQKASSKTLINTYTMYERDLATATKNLNELLNASFDGTEINSQIQELTQQKQRIEQLAQQTLVEAEVDRVRKTLETKLKGAKFSDKDALVLEGSFQGLKQKYSESIVVDEFVEEARKTIATKLGVTTTATNSTPTASSVTVDSTPDRVQPKTTTTTTSSPAVSKVTSVSASIDSFLKNGTIKKIETQLDAAHKNSTKMVSSAQTALDRAQQYLNEAKIELSDEIEQYNYVSHFEQRFNSIKHQIDLTIAEKELASFEKKLNQVEQRISKSLDKQATTVSAQLDEYTKHLSDLKSQKDTTFKTAQQQWQQLVDQAKTTLDRLNQQYKEMISSIEDEEKMKFANEALLCLKNALSCGIEAVKQGSFPAPVRIDRFINWIKYDIHDAHDTSGAKDYNIFINNVIDNSEVVERLVPNLHDELQALRDEAIKQHAVHCVQVCLNKSSDEYLKYLDRYPKTRAYALNRLKQEIRYKKLSHAIHKIHSDKYDYKDPITNQPSNVMVEPNNVEDWFKRDYEPIVPNTVEGGCGNIVFGTDLIPKNTSSEQAEQTFTLGKDNIYARCFWPRTLNQLPIARTTNGEHIKPPKTISIIRFHMELLLYIIVDGKKIERLDLPKKAFSTMKEDEERQDSFYNDTTTCQFGCFNGGLILRGYLSDEWDLTPFRVAKVLSTLEPGDHKIEFELRYRLVTHDYKSFPDFDTPVSEPISKGGFTLKVPSANILQTYDPIPVTTDNSSDLEHEEAQLAQDAIVKYLKQHWGNEEIISVQVQGHYTPVYENRLIGDRIHAVLVQYSLPATVVTYRSPKKGWDRESVAVFEIRGYTPRVDNVAPKIPPLSNISVGSSIDFAPEGLLVDQVLEKYKLRDASLTDNQRRGFDPSEVPASYYI